LKYRKAWSAGLILLVLLAVWVRLRLLSMPLERDEGEYAYSGQLLLQGIPPYQLAFNIKMPGTYAVYALIMALFGQSAAGIHLGFLFVNMGTLALLYFLARRLLDEAGVLVCCAAYVLLSLSSGVLGLQAHATHLVVIHALGGLLLLLRARESGRGLTMFLSGLLFGLSFLCKQPGLFFGLFAAAVLARDAWVAGLGHWRLSVRNLLLFGGGLAAPLAATCLILWRAGTFKRFWFWTVTYARVHTGLLPAGFVTHRLAQLASGGWERWLFLIGVAGWLWLLVQKGNGERKFFYSVFLLCSVAACLIGRYLARHYLIVMLPVAGLLAGLAVPAFASLLGRTRFPLFRAIPPLLFLGACGGLIRHNWPVWFEMPPGVACAAIYFDNPFVECQEVGRFIREHSTPGDRIAVVGSEPEIYFYAQRHSVSGYIYMYDLVEPQPYASAMQQEFIHDVEKARPEFLVLVNVPTSWMTWADANPALYKWIRSYPAPYYDLIGVTEIYPTHTEYRWGKETAAEQRKTDTAIFVFKRR
jgi:hypothetical protein